MQLYSVPSQNIGLCRRIFCVDDVTVPGHHAMEIPVNITRPTLKQNASEWAVELNRLPGFLAASRSLVRDDAVQVFIKVVNLSNHKFTLRRDSFVGTGSTACTNSVGN